jgi:hypothetical protein
MVGYELLPRKAFAQFDQDGFKAIFAQPRSFLPDSQWANIDEAHIAFWNGTKLTFDSLAKLQGLDLVLPEAGPVFGIGTAWVLNNGEETSVFGATLRHGLVVYDLNGGLIAVLPYHRDVDHWGAVKMTLDSSTKRFFLWYQPSEWIDGKTKSGMPSYIDEVDKTGDVIRSWTLPPLPPPIKSNSFVDFLARHLQSPAFFFGGTAYEKIGAMLGSARLRNRLAQRTAEIAICTVVVSLVMAAITWFRARRYYFSPRRAAAWTVFVLLLNIGGFIVFLLAADWPRLVPCPACGGDRPIDAELCPHCHAVWPEPAVTGLEVFDAGRAGVASVAAMEGAS